jgi:hypothetical protein
LDAHDLDGVVRLEDRYGRAVHVEAEREGVARSPQRPPRVVLFTVTPMLDVRDVGLPWGSVP